MPNEVIEKKKLLKRSWAALKDTTLDIKDRQAAYENIEQLSKDIKDIEPSFEIIDLKETQYAWIPSGKEPAGASTVIWPTKIVEAHKAYKEDYLSVVALAVEITKERHPGLAEDSDKFGQIVNATTNNLINFMD